MRCFLSAIFGLTLFHLIFLQIHENICKIILSQNHSQNLKSIKVQKCVTFHLWALSDCSMRFSNSVFSWNDSPQPKFPFTKYFKSFCDLLEIFINFNSHSRFQTQKLRKWPKVIIYSYTKKILSCLKKQFSAQIFYRVTKPGKFSLLEFQNPENVNFQGF